MKTAKRLTANHSSIMKVTIFAHFLWMIPDAISSFYNCKDKSNYCFITFMEVRWLYQSSSYFKSSWVA